MSKRTQAGEIWFVSRGAARRYALPETVIAASRLEEVGAALDRVETAVAVGWHAAGYVAYEAAPAFDRAFVAHPPGGFPLLWFGLYRDVDVFETPPRSEGSFPMGPWAPLVSFDEYSCAIRRIRELIAAGDTYQVNYTFPLRAPCSGDPFDGFLDLCDAQRADFCAYVNLGGWHILSASPELFFRIEGDRIESRPMKGTRPRGLYPEADAALARDLLSSEKDRAENVMIVDLLRNDLGRTAAIGSVQVPALFSLERYETVWQMTSTVAARSGASLPEVFRTLFPCGSVTGAPKVRTMEIIRACEPFPRGVYCGAIGWCAPGRRAEFNVAIRTVTVDMGMGVAEYHVGGGVTWESSEIGEFEECRAKTSVLTYRPPRFDLLESIRWDAESGYFLLAEHLDRIGVSADYFGFCWNRAGVEEALGNEAFGWSQGAARKVRLLLERDGRWRIESVPIARIQTPLRIALAREPVASENVLLYHKTTWRDIYETARAGCPDADDVLLWNARGEVTESTIANVLAEIGGQWFTPPIRCGLLGGVMRRVLLEQGRVREREIAVEELRRASALRLINSVRGEMPAMLVDYS